MPTERRWLFRGFAAAFLLCGALNAGSYFILSENGGNLVNWAVLNHEAFGFPLISWQRGHQCAGYFSFWAVLGNISFATVAGIFAGRTAVRRRFELQRLIAEWDTRDCTKPAPFQFTIRGLFVVMSLAAVMAAVARAVPWRGAEILLSIYLLAPSAMLAAAFVPKRLAWRQRAALLALMFCGLLIASVAAGVFQHPSIHIEKVLLGNFICWMPQAAAAALAPLLWLAFRGAFATGERTQTIVESLTSSQAMRVIAETRG